MKRTTKWIAVAAVMALFSMTQNESASAQTFSLHLGNLGVGPVSPYVSPYRGYTVDPYRAYRPVPTYGYGTPLHVNPYPTYRVGRPAIAPYCPAPRVRAYNPYSYYRW